VSRRQNIHGVYFLPPRDTARRRWFNYGCVAFYYPVIVIDYRLGTGMPPAKEPLWGLSR
jgi:hypothetical protein